MPKEVIQRAGTDQHAFGELTVSWGNEASYVQLAATRHVLARIHWESDDGLCGGNTVDEEVAHLHADHDHCTQCGPNRNRDSGGNVAEVMVDGKIEQPASVYLHLDRNEINRMIRALRRARDGAYGADA